MRHPYVLAVLFVLLGVSIASNAFAQTDAQREEARNHFARATDLVRESRWRDAIVELEATRAIISSPAVLYNLGIARRAVGENRAAIAAFNELLAMPSPAVTPAMRTEAQDFVRELSARFAHVTVRVEPADASVTVDGEPLAGGQSAADLDPGRHVVMAVANGFRPATQIMDLHAGEQAQASLHLALYSTSGHVHVESDLSLATITLDGRDIGTGTADADVDPGMHGIEVHAPGRQTFRDQVNVSIGSNTRVRARLAAPRSVVSSPWLWAGVGLGVVAGAAVVAGALLSGGTAEGVRPPWGVVTTGITVRP